MGHFRIIEEGAFADFEFEAYAKTLEDLFAVCGKAMFEAMTDVSRVEPSQEVEFGVTAESVEDLLFSYLSELVYLKDTRKFFFCDFVIEIKEGEILHCIARGEPIDRDKHELKTDVKAVTYHKLEVKHDDKGYHTRVILDL